MHISKLATALSLCMFAAVASAQQSPTTSSTFTSQPGRVAAAESVKASVVVTAIDKPNRILTLKSADGKTAEMIAGPDVRNFDQIAVNDRVVVEYIRALTLELRKGGGLRESRETADAVRTKKGEKPGAAVGGPVTVMADVIDVSEKEKTITLRGPKGNVVTLDVQNPDHFKVVKKGDQVEADYAEALAVSVQKAPSK